MTPKMHHLVWNVDPEIFSLGPFQPRWYGFFFALGFVLGYEIMAQFYRRERRNLENLSHLLLYLLLGTIIGARLGHVFLYQPEYYLAHPWEILMVWQGGLASHGGFAGVMMAVYLYLKTYRDVSFIELADRLAIPCLLTATLIRIGNFFNSEILGTPSNLPWAIVFARVDDIPRHPAMLYEAVAYFLVFCTLCVAYWKTTIIHFPGRVFGTALATGFLARFMIEFVKENQVPLEKDMLLNMGQLLSIPFVLAGLYLIYASRRKPPTPARWTNAKPAKLGDSLADNPTRSEN
ncbi:MAG TPA: prolipoprotein diacylglyceryl transferase [Candidatus Binatia bacterium]|nr:prolipoprotein diacylglyceryl transferase [Candidatus Binatia bacterium]